MLEENNVLELEQKPERKKRKALFVVEENKVVQKVNEEIKVKCLEEIETIKLENYLNKISIKKYEINDVINKQKNTSLTIDNFNYQINKLRQDIQLFEEQKKNVTEKMRQMNDEYVTYKKMLEQKYSLSGNWGFNPDTGEIDDNKEEKK